VPLESIESNSLANRLERELEHLRTQSRFRALRTNHGIDFTTNDYLGLATSEELRARVREYFSTEGRLSASASRLLRGNCPEHEALEHRYAEYLGYEAALFFNSGYDANLAILTALPTRHDTIVMDSLVHASIKEGAHASLAAKRTFAHNSVESLRKMAGEVTTGDVYVAIESVYSMDGDESPLAALAALCDERGYTLIVDEAHTAGVFGRNGRGIVDELGITSKVHISLHTFGKAFGASGAMVACSQTVKEYLINKARTFIYTTALPPYIPVQIMVALDILERDGSLQAKVHSNARSVREALSGQIRRWHIVEGRSPIIAVLIGGESETLRAQAHLQSQGLDIRAVRPPSVPPNTSRLRVSIHADHSMDDLDRAVTGLLQAEALCAE
jgi:8-amino-7-oxononanoate synthase